MLKRLIVVAIVSGVCLTGFTAFAAPKSAASKGIKPAKVKSKASASKASAMGSATTKQKGEGFFKRVKFGNKQKDK